LARRADVRGRRAGTPEAGRPRARRSALGLIRRFLAALVAIGSLLPVATATAAGPDGSSADRAARLAAAATAIRTAAARVDRLRTAPAPTVAVDQVRAELALAQTGYALRESVRREQSLVYELAPRQDQEQAVLQLLPAADAAGLRQADSGLRATWRLSGYDEGAVIHPRRNKRAGDADPLGPLIGYYRDSAARTGIDWTYLAAINFVESDFGRNNGPSSAGAQGPMQFLPSTFREYGAGGDIMNPRDAIAAAARMLARNGAPSDYGRALFRYNRSQSYVDAITAYAAAIRSDTLWLTRFYYWSTYG
jgi:membrane-bound lytic murein transglycosylase B